MIYSADEENRIIVRSGIYSVAKPSAFKRRYDEPTRFYHTWNHALSVLAWTNLVTREFKDQLVFGPLEYALAAVAHDCVYRVGAGAGENEQASVRVVEDRVHTGFPSVVANAAQLIMATATHGTAEADDTPFSTAIFLDCDMASFGESCWETFEWNNDNIVKEYLVAFHPEKVRVGRIAFLEKLLQKKSIFLTGYFRDKFEVTAQRNITRLLHNLRTEG